MSPRQVSLNVLTDVLSKGAFLNLSLKHVRGYDNTEQNFITALVTTTLEHLYTIDYVLSAFTDLKRTSARVRNILRLGTCQILYMNSVPDSAAVNESVMLARKVAPNLRGFVNGVLRSVAREGKDVAMPDPETDFIKYLSVAFSYPEWMCRLFTDQLGKDEAKRLLAYTGTPGQTCVRRTKRAGEQGFANSVPGIYLDDALYVQHASDLQHNKLLSSGEYTVQSEASMLCVRALGLEKTSKVLDLCAAPGGKSAYAAQIASNGSITACDVHPHRTELIAKTAKRLHLDNVEPATWDAQVLNPEWVGKYDAVLVDAPCSALGLLYRKPDVRYTRKEEDLRELQRTQKAILECARQYVRPGGTLVYSTCTIDQLENQDVLEWFLQEHPEFVRSNLAKHLPGPFFERAANGSLQLLPPKDDIDGFFISRLVRNA